MSILNRLGFDASFWHDADQKSLELVRVIAAHKGQYEVIGDLGEKTAVVSGRMEFNALGAEDLPTVGDWVLVRPGVEGDLLVIEQLCERKTKIVRKKVGGSGDHQMIAANIDFVFLVQSCNRDLNLRRLERYFAGVADPSIKVIVLLTKLDLIDDPDSIGEQVRNVLPDVEVLFVSSMKRQGLEKILEIMAEGTTSVLVGSSGVGKTTLVNVLCEEVKEATAEIREGDDKGRHTTTGRKIFWTKSKGLIIDTPGMREFGLAESSVEESALFTDIQELSVKCQFRDCAHSGEPDCAVANAIANGGLDPKRLESYHKLLREEAFERRRQSKQEMSNSKKKWKQIHKQMKYHPKAHRWKD